MRMIGIGLMGFLLAGIALLLSTMNILETGQRYAREVLQGPQLVFEPRTTAPETGVHRATVYRSNPNHPVLLSGLPAYQSVAFTLPVDARPTSGHLQIDATTQILTGVEGVLRISIRNARRAELLLRPGEAARSLQVPLSPMDFARPQLVVSFSLQGTAPKAPCGPDTGIPASVEIETTSALFLHTQDAMTSPRDRINSWGRMARIAWPDKDTAGSAATRLIQALALKQRGIAPVFVGGGPSDTIGDGDLDTALAAFAPLPAPLLTSARPLAQTRATAGVRRFRTQAVWRETFDLTPAPGGVYANQIALRMTLGAMIGQPAAAFSVTLNGRLVHQAQVAATDTDIAATIPLPQGVQSATNVIEVVLTPSDTRDGHCSEGPERVAELLPTSLLVYGDTPYRDASTDLRAALATAPSIPVAVSSTLTATDAAIALHLLDALVPVNAPLTLAANTAQILVVSPGAPLPRTATMGWRVTLGVDDITVAPLDDAQPMRAEQTTLVVFATAHPVTGVAS